MSADESGLSSPPVANEDQDTVGSQVSLLLVVVFLAFLAQMTLNPIIAPLAREVGLAEWQIGTVISSAAAMLVLSSQFWGRRSQSWGRRPVLISALLIATVAMLGFTIVAMLGMQGLVPVTILFALFVLMRGVLFGSALSAIAPTAQAYIADVTPDEATRTRGMAGIGAVQGIAMIIGAVVGGALAGLGLVAPIAVAPLLLAVAAVLVITKLRPDAKHTLIAKPASVRPFDSRIWPFLLAGFGMFSALGFMQIVMGFLVQDRLHLGPEQTGMVTGASLLAAGVGMVFAQGLVVPRSGWRPGTLLRVGSFVAFLGFVLLAPDLGAVPLIFSGMLTGFGLGLAGPGYTAGASLQVAREEQGSIAGLIGATNGLTFMIAPVLSTLLYGIWGPLPIVVSAIIMGLVVIFVSFHPRFRRV